MSLQKRIATMLGCFLFFQATAQEVSPLVFVANLPEELKKDANAVYRLDEGVLNILSESEYTLHVHQVVTILNAEGANHLHHQLGIDKFYRVDDVDIKVYDALGQLAKTYTKKDFQTSVAFDGITLVNDDKVMRLTTPAPSYPCTLDIRYRTHANSYVELPNWYSNFHKTATQLLRYEVSVPAALDIRQRTLNLQLTPQVESLGNRKRYVWEARNIAAKTLEDDGFEPAQYLPQMEVAPNEFSYDGFKGAFRSWADFGRWNYNLYEEKTPFSPQRITEIKALVAGQSDRDEMIRVLYRYLQQNMRYVSIQLGIGGFKPFAVKFVDEKKYGDCKALTNYMRYLLDVVGVKSYPALINAGHNKRPVDPAFPSDPFNHVILCVPGPKDTTWLECTSTTNRAGELGSFTEHKRALLLTADGGLLVNTPKSAAAVNQVVTHNRVSINENGGAVIVGTINSTGDAASFFQYVSQLKNEEQNELLVKTLRLKNPTEMSMAAKGEMTQATYEVNRSYEKLYDFKTGSKYFFPVCVNRLVTQTLENGNRKTDFVAPYPYQKTDTTLLQLGSGFTLESLPANKQLQTAHSRYSRNCRYNSDTRQLEIVSTLSLLHQVIPAQDYPGLVQFFKDAAVAEEEVLILTKQAGSGF